ncbi:MAG: Peptide chain release factor 2 [Planctomycetota bacterium]|jgi:peptide chain release factor 2
MASPTFWDSQERAQGVVQDLKNLRKVVEPLRDVLGRCEDLGELLAMAEEDPSILDEVQAELAVLEPRIEQLEIRSLLNGANDDCGAILSVHAREGGLDANDWAEMLLGMYTAWAQQHGFSVELLDRSDDETAGITQATIAVRGESAYGYLKGEEGIHRLVRISPYNAEGKRQTSFAAVDVSPEIDDSVDIEIAEKDVREDVFRASGAGGQHVNKTSSAIRLTHIPTGIAVQCQNERSQHKNRAAAWKMLRSRLARIEEEKREAEQLAKYQSKAMTGFGSQIRNYFLHPDQRVKDARTGFQMGNFHTVLSGDIQGFLDAFLRYRMMNMQPHANNG